MYLNMEAWTDMFLILIYSFCDKLIYSIKECSNIRGMFLLQVREVETCQMLWSGAWIPLIGTVFETLNIALSSFCTGLISFCSSTALDNTVFLFPSCVFLSETENVVEITLGWKALLEDCNALFSVSVLLDPMFCNRQFISFGILMNITQLC